LSNEGCWVQESWQKDGLAVVVVARRQPNGNIVFGNYLVDCYCLGLKNTFCNADIPYDQFHHDFLPEFFRAVGKPIRISPALAHEIIYGAIEYAAQFGFRPQRDYRDSQYILDPPNVHPRSGKVTFGKDGKPFFFAGPYDNVDAIMRKLARTAGEGNYHYMVRVDGALEGWFGDEWNEEDEGTFDLLGEVESTPTRSLLGGPELAIGESVVVKPGVQDPDLEQDIGGWQGRITDIGPGEDENTIVTIRWDSLTLKNMPAWVIEQCDKEGLDWAVMNLDAQLVERAAPRDKLEDVIRVRMQIAQRYPISASEQNRRISRVLASVAPNDMLAAYDAWDEYLTRHLLFPFEARVVVSREQGSLQPGEHVRVLHISALGELRGIIVRVRAKQQDCDFPLCDLEVVDRRSPNYQAVDDYATWFANC